MMNTKTGTEKKDFFAGEQEQADVMAQLLALGIHRMEALFSGEGKEGIVESVRAYDNTGRERSVEGLTIRMSVNSLTFSTTAGRVVGKEFATVPVSSGMQDFVEFMADEYDMDWRSDDGGAGQVVITLGENPTVVVTADFNEPCDDPANG